MKQDRQTSESDGNCTVLLTGRVAVLVTRDGARLGPAAHCDRRQYVASNYHQGQLSSSKVYGLFILSVVEPGRAVKCLGHDELFSNVDVQ